MIQCVIDMIVIAVWMLCGSENEWFEWPEIIGSKRSNE